MTPRRRIHHLHSNSLGVEERKKRALASALGEEFWRFVDFSISRPQRKRALSGRLKEPEIYF